MQFKESMDAKSNTFIKNRHCNNQRCSEIIDHYFVAANNKIFSLRSTSRS